MGMILNRYFRIDPRFTPVTVSMTDRGIVAGAAGVQLPMLLYLAVPLGTARGVERRNLSSERFAC